MRRFIISFARVVGIYPSIRAIASLSSLILCSMFLIALPSSFAAEGDPLPGTERLTMTGDIARQLLDGAHRFVDAQTAEAIKRRTEAFKTEAQSPESFERSLEEKRTLLAGMLGAFDQREPWHGFELLATTEHSSLLFDCDQYAIHAVRWPAVSNVHGEGLLIEPKNNLPPKYAVIVLAGEDPTDKQLEFVATLASSGVRVLLPVMVDRGNEYSSTANGTIKTGLTNREFCYRPAFELRHHLIGYEVQKSVAAAEGLVKEGEGRKQPVTVGMIDLGGYGPIGLYAMALCRSISFGQINLGNGMAVPMDQQPLDQNVFGFLEECAFADLMSMVAPRRLVLSESREWNRSKDRRTKFGERGGPSPTLNDEYPKTPDGNARWQKDAETLEEAYFAKHSLANELSEWQSIVKSKRKEGVSTVTIRSGDEEGIDPTLLNLIGIDEKSETISPAGFSYTNYLKGRIGPQVREIIDDTQELLEESPYTRDEYWKDGKEARKEHSLVKWKAATDFYRTIFEISTIGSFDGEMLPAHPRTRQVYDTPAFTGYEVVLDVYPELIAYGILLVPKGIKEGERRPVVVTQHGLEGRPQDVADPSINNPAYNQYGCRLAERGFVVFAPQNLYIFHDRFRHLQRKLNPIGKTLFSVIVPQHQQIVDWLETLPFVDGKRIGFYGLSYGGKSAMRIPALVEKYALSICSADFNDWVWKNASTRSPYSYVNTMEYEIFEFGLGPTFNYAEMAALIAPRPFMVERGHHDGVAPDDRVASEYAKIRLMYSDLGIPDRTEIEFFNGPHTIHGVGTFKFLHRHLNWPSPSDPVPLNK